MLGKLFDTLTNSSSKMPLGVRIVIITVILLPILGLVIILLSYLPILAIHLLYTFALWRTDLFILVLSIFICMLSGIYVFRLIRSRSITERKGFFKKISKEQSWTFGKDAKPSLTRYFYLSIKQNSSKFINAFMGKDWKYGDFLHTIEYQLGGKNRKITEVYYSVLELQLTRKLPHIFFDSAAHGTRYKTVIDPSQRTTLEGDFDQYFVTYFPLNYHIDARSIISPEVMAAIIDAGTNDIEIFEDRLYLYSKLMPKEEVAMFIERGNEIRKKLLDHAVYYRDERLEKYDRKSTSVFGKSLRLQPQFPKWGLYVAPVVFIFMAPYFFNSAPKTQESIVMNVGAIWVLVLAWLLHTCFSWWRVQEYNKQLDKAYREYLKQHQVEKITAKAFSNNILSDDEVLDNE